MNDRRWRARRRDILLVAFLLALALVSIIFFSLLTKGGVANAGDLTWPYYNEPPVSGLYLENVQSGLVPNQMLVYSWMFYLPLDPALLERLFFFGVFVLMGVSSFYAVFRVLEHEGADKRFTYVLAGAGAIAYVVNPLTFYYMVDLFLLLGFALLPALVYSVFKFMWSSTGKGFVKYGVLTGVLIAASSGDPRWPVWDLFLVGLILVVVLPLSRFRGLVRSLGYALTALVSFAALSAFWILPTLAASTKATLLARPDLSVSFYYILNKYATLGNSIVLQADFWTPARGLFVPSDGLLMLVWKIAQLALPILALVAVILFWRKKEVVALAVISLLVLFIASAPLSPFQFIKDAYQYFVFNLPFGVAFRTSYKWLLVLVFPMVLLAIYAIWGIAVRLAEKRYRITNLRARRSQLTKVATGGLILLFVGSSSIAAWPLLTGDNHGVIVPAELSGDYKTVYGTIERQSDQDYGFKILYLPTNPKTGFPAPGLADSPYLHYLTTMLQKGTMNDLGTLLGPLNVRYIVVDKTAYSDATLENVLKGQADLSVAYEGDQLLLLKNEQTAPQFRLSQPAIDFQGMDAGSRGLAWNDWVQTDQGLNGVDDAFGRSAYVLMGDGYPWNLLASHAIVSSPFKYVGYYGDPSWQTDVTYSPSNYDWPILMDSMGMSNWELDFGEGLAFTDVNSSLPPNLPLPADHLVKGYDFSDPSTVRQWVDQNPSVQFGARQTLTRDGDGLRVDLLDATSGWKTVKSPLVAVDPDQAYTLTAQISSSSGYEIHVKVAEYDANGSWLNTGYIEGLGTGEFDWTTVRFNYQPTSSDVRYINLQFWHGSDPTTSLPNEFWIRSVAVYNTTDLWQPPRMDGKISVPAQGQYRVGVRALASPRGGEITVAIDGQDFEINTTGSSADFRWFELGPLNLSAGSHDVSIMNDQGFNAVNLIALVEEQEYASLISGYRSELQDKALIYPLAGALDGSAPAYPYPMDTDPASDLYGQYRVLDKEITVARPGNYTIYVDSNQSSSVLVDGTRVGDFNGSHAYGSTFLSAGAHTISLRSPDPVYQLNDLVLFSANAGSSLDELRSFQGPNGTLVVTKENPSLYHIELRTTGNATVVFSDAYDSSWTMGSDGGSSFSTGSVPIDAATNGFMFDANGTINATMSYSLDQPYHEGMIISLTSGAIILAVALLFHYRDGPLLTRLRRSLRLKR